MPPQAMTEVEDITSAIRQASLSAASAVMRIEVAGDVGYLFFLDGEVAHASTLELEGEPAVTAILSWGEGHLAWCERRWPRERSVRRSWTELAAAEPVGSGAAARSVPEVQLVRKEPPQSLLSSDEVHFPSSLGIRQALSRAELQNALQIASSGHVTDSRGRTGHLRGIVHSCLSLGDSLGAALGLGPLIAAEASMSGFQRLIARSSDGASAVETAGGSSLQLARAFLKL